MGKRGDISQGKLASGLLGVGLASGLVAASLGVVGPASASCFNFSGVAIGGGCVASFGSIAIVIGPTPTEDTEDGSLAAAGNPDEFSPFNFALSVGGTATQPTLTAAGVENAGGLPAIGNLSLATAGSSADSIGLFNLAGSFGGTRSQLTSEGVGNSTLNLGSDNDLVAEGAFNNATVLSGNENVVQSANDPGLGLIPTPGLNVAFNVFGNNNEAEAGPGPGAIAGLIGVNDQNGDNAVTNSDFGIELRTPFNVEPPASTSLAGGNMFRPTTFAAGSFNRAGSQLSVSLTNAGKQFSSSLNSLSKTFSDTGSSLNSLSKTFSDTGSSLNSLSKTFKKVTGGLAGGTEAGTASTSSDE